MASEHTLDLAAKKRREGCTVSSLHCIKPLAEAFADIFLVEPDAMQSQQPFDPPDDANPLLDQVLPLTLYTLRVLLLDAWNLHRTGHLAVSRQPSSENARHTLRIEAVGLRNPAATRHHEACRIENVRGDAASNEITSEREAIISDLVAEHDLQPPPKSLLGLCLAAG